MNYTTAVASIILSLGIWLSGSATLSAATLNVGDIVFVQQSGGRVSYIPGAGPPTLTNLSAPLTLEPLDFANSSLGPSLPSPQLISQGGFLFDPNHILVDPLGRILTAERTSTPSIVRIDPATGTQTRITSGSLLTRPVTLAFDQNQNLVVANDNGNGTNRRLVQVNMNTGVQTLIANLTINPQDVDVDSNGQIVVTEFGSRIFRINPLTGISTTISSGGLLSTLSDLVIQQSGNYLVSNRVNSTTSQILEIDAGTGAQRLITTMPREGWIALENADSLIYADFHKTIPITRIDLATGATTPLSDLNYGTGNITGVAVVTAIPEPSSIAGCVLVGLAVAGWVRRKTGK